MPALLYVMVAKITLDHTTAEWPDLFKRPDNTAMPVNSIDDLIDDRHLADVGFFDFVEHPTEGRLRQMRPSSTWSDTQPRIGRPAPNLGQHSREVLAEVGYSADEPDALAAGGVIEEWRGVG